MSDYISRQVAIEMLDEQIALCDKALKSFGISMNDEYAVKVERASLAAYKEQLEALPAADVVPVVRCDDCEYYGSRRWCELHSSVFDDNAFCSYGERKE